METRKIGEGRFAFESRGCYFAAQTFPFEILELDVETLDSAAEEASHIEWEPLGQDYAYDGFGALELILTTGCNLRCRHCYALYEQDRNLFGLPARQLDLSTAKRAIDFTIGEFAAEIVSSGVEGASFELFLFGGEPLLNWGVGRESFLYLESRLRQLEQETGVRITCGTQVVTNGTLITPEIAAFIAEKQLEATVSLDSPFNPMRFFALDQSSATLAAVSGLKLLLAAGAKKVNINMVVPANCVDRIDDIFGYFASLGVLEGITTVTMSPQAPPIRAPEGLYTDTTAYDEAKCATFAAKLIEYAVKLGLDMKFYRRKMRSLLSQGGVAYRCPGALWKWCVDPGGDAYPCYQLLGVERFKMGNVADRNLAESMAAVRREFAERTVFKANPCSDCLLQTLCMPFVDCPARCYIERGNLYDVPSHYCLAHRPYLEFLFEEFLWEQIGASG